MSQAADQEPRRSVRATKGQHTKAFDQLEQPVEPVPKKRQGRKKKDEKPEEPEEEIIRCVCGATEQDEDSGEPWIACDKCAAWQHNVCMGMSIYTDDLPKNYYCEQCSPQDHKELLDGVARGEKPWEARRRAYEEEEAERKNKKRGKKGGQKGKRVSDPKKDEITAPPNGKASSLPPTPAPASAQAAASTPTPSASTPPGPAPAPAAAPSPAPAPTAKDKKDKKENNVAPRQSTGKRKSRDETVAADSTTPAQKLRKVSETEAVPVDYTPPADIPAKISELPDSRQGPAKLLHKSLVHAIGISIKKGDFQLTDGATIESKSERLALEIERAVHDSHPVLKEYAQQTRSVSFNIKSNQELCNGLLRRTLTPSAIALMTSDELASRELQRETAEMKARAEKQSILITDEAPRLRRTHKGEEMVESESFLPTDETPSVIRRPSVRDPAGEATRHDSTERAESPLQIDTQPSPKQPDFDINKVFSSVKSPTSPTQRRPSMLQSTAAGPGVDPDVDRLLQEDSGSPPYSPTEETDPDVIWRGSLFMNSIADFHATIRYAGGAKVSETAGLPWTTLIPRRLTVAGRIDQQKAIEYLCSLRYSDITDLVVTSITPTAESSKGEFQALVDYFVSKKRYGVIGEKGVGNVRDTYLVPVLPGDGNFPEFMLNIEDNLIPQRRTEPMLLVVFVYRNDRPAVASDTSSTPTPTPAQAYPGHRLSVSGPAFSPTSPQGPFATPPVYPQRNNGPPAGSSSHQQPTPTPATHLPHRSDGSQPSEGQRALQQAGVNLATEVLGALITSPTVQFILPQAFQMTRKEWEIVKEVFEKDPKARDDLQHLSALLEKQGSSG